MPKRFVSILVVLVLYLLAANSQCTTRYCYHEEDAEASISETLWRLKRQLNEREETIYSLQDQLEAFENKFNQSNENVCLRNECQTNNGGCSQECIDTYHSYYCSCHPGYRLENKTLALACKGCVVCGYVNSKEKKCFCRINDQCDQPVTGTGCIDIDECSEHNGGCEQSCVNTEGSFLCGCRNGFKLATNLWSCEDVNECEEHVCGNDKCINTYSDYFCASPAEAGPIAHDCADLFKQGHTTSGVYYVYVRQTNKFIAVYCDMDTDGGGWLVFQRRDGTSGFYRYWDSYKIGFGNVSAPFWIGNDHLHCITSTKNYTLRIDMKDYDGETRYATYSTFEVASENSYYKLKVGGYAGDAGDAMKDNDGMYFSTKNRDNDECSCHCSQSALGGWWYNDCGLSNLNGYNPGTSTPHSGEGILWVPWHGWEYSLKDVEMKLRP